MKGIILYTSKTGVTEDVSKLIQEYSVCKFDLIKISKDLLISNFDEYDCVVVGTPTYVSRAPKIMRDYIQTNYPTLLQKPVFLFTVGGESNVDFDASLPLSFPEEFISHLQLKRYLGGEFRFEKMGFLSRFILKSVQKNKEKNNPEQGSPTIQYESIKQFCLDLDTAMH